MGLLLRDYCIHPYDKIILYQGKIKRREEKKMDKLVYCVNAQSDPKSVVIIPAGLLYHWIVKRMNLYFAAASLAGILFLRDKTMDIKINVDPQNE